MNIKFFLFAYLSLLSSARTEPGLPTLTLPWGSYPATTLANDEQNVRFGAKPVRFGESDFPSKQNSSIQLAPEVTDCLQINPHVLRNPPGGRKHLGDPNDDTGSTDWYAPTANWSGTEDCLFLDVYVPRSVFRKPNSGPLPVVVWFYGGAYAFGTKRMPDGPLYSGRSLIEASGYNTILVAGNYRLGAFGWLAGSFMQEHGLPNAGLYDQNLVLRWVQKYIDRVNGDKTQVSAWGESAGGGSILHHLIRDEGESNPLFSRFVTQSPAFEWAWDNSVNGQLDQVFQDFSKTLKCNEPYDIECLRNDSIPISELASANVDLFKNVKQTGLFPIGPSVDGKWIKTIPTLAFSQGRQPRQSHDDEVNVLTGKFWTHIDSAIVSHCANDAQSFTPQSVTDNATFNAFLTRFLPGDKLSPARMKISKQYDCQNSFKGNYNECLKHVIRDASFTCNTRDLLESYPQQGYAMNYGYPNDEQAYHATDLIPLFAKNPVVMGFMLHTLGYNWTQAAIWGWRLSTQVVPTYIKYLASFARYGNTNSTGNYGWPVVNGTGDMFSNVMKPSSKGWKLSTDDQNSKDVCSFWNGIAQDIMDTRSESRWKTNQLSNDVGSQEEL